MGGNSWRGAIGALLALALLALVAGFAYQAGTHAAVPAAGSSEVRMHGGPGFFFFPFFLFFPLGFILFVVLMKALFWGGPRRWSDDYYGGPYRGGPAGFEEWHRRMHDQPGTPPATPTAPTPPSDPSRPTTS